jgi:hypothetical protein
MIGIGGAATKGTQSLQSDKKPSTHLTLHFCHAESAPDAALHSGKIIEAAILTRSYSLRSCA